MRHCKLKGTDFNTESQNPSKGVGGWGGVGVILQAHNNHVQNAQQNPVPLHYKLKRNDLITQSHKSGGRGGQILKARCQKMESKHKKALAKEGGGKSLQTDKKFGKHFDCTRPSIWEIIYSQTAYKVLESSWKVCATSL